MSQAPIATPSLDLCNIQGDVLLGVPKKVERYIFLEITDVEKFRTSLTNLVPYVTTTESLQHTRNRFKEMKEEANRERAPFPLQPITGLTVGFSASGLKKLGQNLDDLGAEAEFKAGMLKDAVALGDPIAEDGLPKWLDEFKHPIDFVIDIAGDSWKSIEGLWQRVEHIFGIGTKYASLKIVHHINGNVRPGKEAGHEHFGFKDGISQPLIDGIDQPPPTDSKIPTTIDPANILLGHKVGVEAPAWTVDGTFLAFRQLAQLVPEFDKFLVDNPIVLPGLSREKGSELLGARFVGRWKSGAPIDVSPLHDDPSLGNDPTKDNDFDYAHLDDPQLQDQARCPFSAHTRKTNPRADLGDGSFDDRRIIRRGIPYGPEVSYAEQHDHKTHTERGLAFACYNTSITAGFHFLQRSWANNQTFPPNKPVQAGFDPIIGQNGNEDRTVRGTNPQQQSGELTLPFDFVVPRGGEYFFVPSISCLRDVLAHGVHIA